MLATRRFVLLQALMLAPAIVAMVFVYVSAQPFDRAHELTSRNWEPLVREIDQMEEAIEEMDSLIHRESADPTITSQQFEKLSASIDTQLGALGPQAAGVLSASFRKELELFRSNWTSTRRLILVASWPAGPDAGQTVAVELELHGRLEEIRGIRRRVLTDINSITEAEAAESAAKLRIAGACLLGLSAAIGLVALILGLRSLQSTSSRLVQVRAKLATLLEPDWPTSDEFMDRDPLSLVEQALSRLETLITDKELLSVQLGRVATEWVESFDSVGSPMLVVEPDGHICRLNRAARDLAGGQYSELIGTTIGSVASCEPWTSASELNRSLGGSASRQASVRASDRVWEIAIYRAEHRRVLVLDDRTEMEQLQERLKRAEMMSTLGTLLARVAHEVRNPLFSLSAALDALECEDELQEVFPDYLQRLRTDLQRLSLLMRDLLEFGRPRERSNSEIDLVELVTRIAGRLPEDLGRTDVRVEIDSGERQELLRVTGSAGDLGLAVRNVVDNAIRHSPHGGVVRVRLLGEDGKVRISVRDEGNGFRPEEMKKVFDPFYSNRKGGTGIGLALVKEIVEVHSGRAVAYNAGGGGGIVDLTLPARGSA